MTPLARKLCSTVAFHCSEYAVFKSLSSIRAELDRVKAPPPAAAALARIVYSFGLIVNGWAKKSVEFPVKTE